MTNTLNRTKIVYFTFNFWCFLDW